MPERILDDIWAEEAGVSIRFVALEQGRLHIELTNGVGRPSVHMATLTDWRAKRAMSPWLRHFSGRRNSHNGTDYRDEPSRT